MINCTNEVADDRIATDNVARYTVSDDSLFKHETREVLYALEACSLKLMRMVEVFTLLPFYDTLKLPRLSETRGKGIDKSFPASFKVQPLCGTQF